eukprot:GGOE01032751.1.p1 GENE.GGOE01032751.1~~GGOE01032751.1.p1  ORF type:complete len:424 (+),score=29.77 GGOE01032751.1:77-1348(+)
MKRRRQCGRRQTTATDNPQHRITQGFDASPPPLRFQSLIEAPVPFGDVPVTLLRRHRLTHEQSPSATYGQQGDMDHCGEFHIRKPTSAWTVDDTCVWLDSLGLSQDHRTLAREQHLVGSIVLSMQEEDWRRLGVNAFGDLRIIQLATEVLRDRRNQGAPDSRVLTPTHSSEQNPSFRQQSGDTLKTSRMVGGAARSLRQGTKSGVQRDDQWDKVADEHLSAASGAVRPLADSGMLTASLCVLNEVGQIPRLKQLEGLMEQYEVSRQRQEVIRTVWFAMGDRERDRMQHCSKLRGKLHGFGTKPKAQSTLSPKQSLIVSPKDGEHQSAALEGKLLSSASLSIKRTVDVEKEPISAVWERLTSEGSTSRKTDNEVITGQPSPKRAPWATSAVSFTDLVENVTVTPDRKADCSGSSTVSIRGLAAR